MAENQRNWEELVVPPEKVLARIEPGMAVFLGTGVAEPRTLVKHLMASEAVNIQDLELIQIVSFGEAITVQAMHSRKFRLKTFFSGWVADEAISGGRVDLIPSRFVKIPELVETGQIHFDVAFIQITPPNLGGYCSLGVAVDIARQVMDQAGIVVGEVNPKIPFTYGDTFVPLSDFDYLVKAEDDPIYFPRWPVDDVFDQVAANVASVIEDGSCLGFSIGPLYDALGKQLVHKRHLGIHSPFITDAIMDLVRSGAVTNRFKAAYKGKCLASYALGTEELLAWLDRNPLVEFQSIETVFNPIVIGRNPRAVTVLPVRKVDLSGRVALHVGRGNVVATAGEVMNFLNGSALSAGGLSIFALPSRNRRGEPNILLSVEQWPNLFTIYEAVDMVVTEYGVANLRGRTVRERAQALIDVAHPDDRGSLVERAKEENILYRDQIYYCETGYLYPSAINTSATFKGGVEVRFRAIKPSDEEEMRRLFYRFSDKAVYYRYFTPIKVMPHARMQAYVNVDPNQVVSIVGLVGPPGQGRIIAEARFGKDPRRPGYADVAFVVDEQYQGLGIASKMYEMLIDEARKRGLKGLVADVLGTNTPMMKVFEKGPLPVKATISGGIYQLVIDLEPQIQTDV